MRYALLLLIAMLIISFAKGQESENYTKLKNNYNYYEGYIITKDSVKIEGLIKLRLMEEKLMEEKLMEERLIEKQQMEDSKNFSLIFLVNKDGQKTKYKPADLIEFTYSNKKFVSDKSSFYQIIFAGNKMSLYKHMSSITYNWPGLTGTPGYTFSAITEDLYVKRPHEIAFKPVKKKKFKIEFANYFSDCESIKLNIENETYTVEDIEEIVQNYNWCN